MVILAALFLLIGLSEGASEDRVVPAEEVLASIMAGKPANFDGCTIEGDLYLKAFEITGPVHFNHTTFRNRANFGDATFKDDAYFGGADFNGTAGFQDAVFNGDAYFRDAWFNDEANFRGAGFNGTANFWYAGFNGYADFWGAGFSGDAYFRGADFNPFADFWGAGFNGTADFRGAGFSGDADFRDAGFNGFAYFQGADFNITDFSGAQFNKEAHFENALFEGTASFDNSRFKEDALFENATFRGELSLTRARYDKLFIRWHNIAGGLVYDDAAYMSLMKNFKSLGYYEDYDSCYFQYRKAHRDQPWPTVSGWEASIRKVIDYPMEWFYGYGTKPFNAFFFSLVIVLVFAIFWWAVRPGGPKDKNLASLQAGLSPGEEWLDGGITDILGFSVTVFLSGTRFFIDPPALPRIEGRSRSMIKKAFILERLLGALFSILFFIAISGTIVRAS